MGSTEPATGEKRKRLSLDLTERSKMTIDEQEQKSNAGSGRGGHSRRGGGGGGRGRGGHHGGAPKKEEAIDYSNSTNPFIHDFLEYRDRLDDYHDRRERIIKTSRDITANSKKLSVSLGRVSGHGGAG